MSDFEVFEVPDFMLEKGGVLPTARLAYVTRGTLNAARDNAVLVPSWYTGTHADSETFMLGADRALDPGRYFIILTNLLGGGLSSSPSNSPPPVERGRFPKVTIHDNVRLQHRLVTERLGVERLRLVTGFSMGACQTFQWAAQFPDMVRAACPIAGSARTGNYNSVGACGGPRWRWRASWRPSSIASGSTGASSASARRRRPRDRLTREEGE
jgi:homoserine O-acetyltransferase